MDSLKPSLSGGTLTSWLFCFSLLHIEKNVKHKECKKKQKQKQNKTNKQNQTENSGTSPGWIYISDLKVDFN